jgi:hypothetical protein
VVGGNEMPVQIRYVKTILNFFNVYLVGDAQQSRVTVSPAKMSELFPELSPKAKLGCGQLNAAQAVQLFGNVLKEVS